MEVVCKTSASSGQMKKKKSKNKLKIKDIIHSMYISEWFEKSLHNCWRNNGQPVISDTSENKDLKIVNTPFNCAFIPNIIKDTNLLKEVSTELETLDLQYKNNDLYKFKCTEDLKGVNKVNIQKLCKYIEGPIKQWVQKVTGLALNDKVAISCSKYDYSDILLCHDDELEGRRIAFIFYLTPSWKKKYGGSLDLFSVDQNNCPFSITQRFYPQFNSFAFFEVSPVSFHQVAEVLVENKTRLSINGWFHGEKVKYPPRPVLKSSIFILPGEVEEHVVYSWISPLYLDQNTQVEVRKEFQEKSEIQLSDFLKKKKYDQLAEALKSKDLNWKWVGPPNKRHLEVVNRSFVPDIVKEYLSLMQSEAMFLILSQLTGLELHHLAPQDDESSVESEPASELDSDSENKDFSMKMASNCVTSKVDRPSTSEENGVIGSCTANKKKKRKNKGAKIENKRRKFEDKSEPNDETQNGNDSAVGGLLDGWESDVEGEVIRDIVASSNTRAEVSSEVRRWRWGTYSLMRDDDLRCNDDFVLDAMLFCNGSRDWDVEFGGGTVYVAKGEDEELLTVIPVPNSLALVYRDKETFKFTKHMNVKSKILEYCDVMFNEIICEYRERVEN